MRIVAREIYRADDVEIPHTVQARLTELEKHGYGHFAVCMAKTQYSFSTDPSLKGAPTRFTIPVREVRLAMGGRICCGHYRGYHDDARPAPCSRRRSDRLRRRGPYRRHCFNH